MPPGVLKASSVNVACGALQAALNWLHNRSLFQAPGLLSWTHLRYRAAASGASFPSAGTALRGSYFFRYFGRAGRQRPWHCSFFDHALVKLGQLTVLLLNALLAYQRHLMLGAADFHGVTVGNIEKRGNGLMTQIGPDRVRRSMIRS